MFGKWKKLWEKWIEVKGGTGYVELPIGKVGKIEGVYEDPTDAMGAIRKAVETYMYPRPNS